MIKRQWLLWSALIAAVSFASYTYGALQQSRHALAATSGTLLGRISTGSNSNNTASHSALLNTTVSAQSSVQFQVGKTETLAQWEGLANAFNSNTNATSKSTADSTTNQLNSTSVPSEPGLSGPWPAALANLLQSFGVPLQNLGVKGPGLNGLGQAGPGPNGLDNHVLINDKKALLARLNQLHLPQIQPVLAIDKGPHAINQHAKHKGPKDH